MVATVREWVARDVTPNASALEQADEFPAEMVEQLKAFGLFGSKIDPTHGGLGLDTLT